MHNKGRQLLSVGIVISGAILGVLAFDYFDRGVLAVSYDEEIVAELCGSFRQSGNDWEPNFGSGTMSIRCVVGFDGIIITVHVITYIASETDSELISYDRTLVDSRYRKRDYGFVSTGGSGMVFNVDSKVVHIESVYGRTDLIAMYWFDVGGRQTDSRLLAKLYGLLNILTFREDSSVIVLVADCEGNCARAANALQALATKIFIDADGSYKSIIREEAVR